ncbi:NRAMP family divalent metal transporter [Oceanithermus desulfurans]|uniref:Iron transporter n=2 Tax=Oceanithermus desulfurans TaxID=227924 RepID=A0A511RLX8_9DEIN|nr:divalent metal cation transporter [Oceanithermus desulfurans]MBB6029917.1 Mn2+/Fe2+ NRAMP family transporter [Oceanithermus desulfurans]GEM90663.1 iron transporter [Oceanithermus desulfurans NBRC 100063]
MPKPSQQLERELPALITGGAGDDPAGVITYTVVGATTGFTQLWLLLLTTPMLAAATTMAAKVALASGKGLTSVLAGRYGRIPSGAVVFFLLLANMATIAADTAGVAVALSMFSGVRWEVWVLPVLALLSLLLLEGYQRVKQVLAFLTAALLAYFVAAWVARPDAVQVALGFLPQLEASNAWMIAALGLLGTTISPYMMFWQAGEELEEIQAGIVASEDQSLADTWPGMLYSNLIAAAIVVASAAVLHATGAQVQTVEDAARALSPLGRLGYGFFIAGFIASGLLALPTLSGATAYAVAEWMGWPEGMGAGPARARGFYVVFVGGLVLAGLIALLPHFNPAQALYYSQVFDGVLLPLMLMVLLFLSNDVRLTGRRNPLWVNVAAVLGVVFAVLADAAALFFK